jgi:hypothetical protein
VARSGELDVPGERYNERRLVCRSVSSASKNCSLEEEEEGDELCILDVEGLPGVVEGVSGTASGVNGLSPNLGACNDAGVAASDLGVGLAASAPRVLKSTPSLKTTVPPSRKACSKSRSTREVRLDAVSLEFLSLDATGCNPVGKDEGGMTERCPAFAYRNIDARMGRTTAGALSDYSRSGRVSSLPR